MKDSVNARCNFIRNAMAGNYTVAEAEAELERMEHEYGEQAFLLGTVPRKPRPWTKKDLNDLEKEVIAGAGSREMLSYMAEMGAEVRQNERRKKKVKIIGMIAVIVALIAVVGIVVRMLRG